MTPSALSIITTTFEEGAERNKALGIWGALGGIGGDHCLNLSVIPRGAPRRHRACSDSLRSYTWSQLESFADGSADSPSQTAKRPRQYDRRNSAASATEQEELSAQDDRIDTRLARGVIGDPVAWANEYFEAQAAAMDPKALAYLRKKRPRRLGK
jgi:hypothetical protein